MKEEKAHPKVSLCGLKIGVGEDGALVQVREGHEEENLLDEVSGEDVSLCFPYT